MALFSFVHTATFFQAPTRLPKIAPGKALLLFGLICACPSADCQNADSKGQKPPTAKTKPQQPPPANAAPSKSAPKTTLPNQTAPQQSPLLNPQSTIENRKSSIRLPLLGPLPVTLQQKAVRVDVEAGALGNSLPTFWRGDARTPAFGLANTPIAPPASPNFISLRKGSGATLTRVLPFTTPGTLTLHPDGTPIVRWESVDAALRQAGQAGEDVIFNLQCPAGLSPDGWHALVEAVLRHYRDNPPASIARWEVALSAGEVGARYEPFARLVRSFYPTTPVGLNLLTENTLAAANAPAGNMSAGNMSVGGKKSAAGNAPAADNASAAGMVAEGVRRVAQVCVQGKVPLDSIAWKLADKPALATQQVERVRRVLVAFPTLKNVFLLPTLGLESVALTPAQANSVQSREAQSFVSARLLAFVAKMLESSQSAPPNAFVGALLEEPTKPLPRHSSSVGNALTVKAGAGRQDEEARQEQDEELAAEANAQVGLQTAQQALALLNRMAGTRVRAQSNDSGIACLAARSQGHTFALLWREPAAGNKPGRPSRLTDGGNALIVAHLQHLGLENSAGIRVTQTDLTQTLANSANTASSGLPLRAKETSAAGAETNTILPPSGVSTIFWSSNPAPTNVVPPSAVPTATKPAFARPTAIIPPSTRPTATRPTTAAPPTAAPKNSAPKSSTLPTSKPISKPTSAPTNATQPNAAQSNVAPINATNASAANVNAAPTDVEIPVLLEPGSVCLLEIAPIKAKPVLALTLSTQDANLNGGDPFSVVLAVRNLSARPQNLELALASRMPDLLPQGGAQFKPGLLAANGIRSFRFGLRAPVLAANANVSLTARIGDSAAALTVPVQSPLEASLESPRTDVESGTGRANIRVRLANRSRAPLSVHLQSGDSGENKAGTSITVPPGGKPVTTILAVSPASHTPGLYPTQVRVESSARLLQTLRPVIGVPLVCPYAVAKPVIDGDLREWTGNVPLGMGRAEQARGKAWGGPADVSAYAYALWDEQYFYFACAVTDDVFTPPPNSAGLMQGDCVLFALAVAPRNGSPTGRAPYAKFGMAVAQDGLGASHPVLVRLSPAPKASGRATTAFRETAAPVKNARIAVRREDTRAFYEAAIPWSELLSQPPTPDFIVSLAITVNDVDGRIQGTMEWGSLLTGAINPLFFPPLRLVKLPAR